MRLVFPCAIGENEVIACISLFIIRKFIPIAVIKVLYFSFVYCLLQYSIMY